MKTGDKPDFDAIRSSADPGSDFLL